MRCHRRPALLVADANCLARSRPSSFEAPLLRSFAPHDDGRCLFARPTHHSNKFKISGPHRVGPDPVFQRVARPVGRDLAVRDLEIGEAVRARRHGGREPRLRLGIEKRAAGPPARS